MNRYQQSDETAWRQQNCRMSQRTKYSLWKKLRGRSKTAKLWENTSQKILINRQIYRNGYINKCRAYLVICKRKKPKKNRKSFRRYRTFPIITLVARVVEQPGVYAKTFMWRLISQIGDWSDPYFLIVMNICTIVTIVMVMYWDLNAVCLSWRMELELNMNWWRMVSKSPVHGNWTALLAYLQMTGISFYGMWMIVWYSVNVDEISIDLSRN